MAVKMKNANDRSGAWKPQRCRDRTGGFGRLDIIFYQPPWVSTMDANSPPLKCQAHAISPFGISEISRGRARASTVGTRAFSPVHISAQTSVLQGVLIPSTEGTV